MTRGTSSNAANLSGQSAPDEVVSSQESRSSIYSTDAPPVVTPGVAQSSQVEWPADTDLRFPAGKPNKITLTAQSPSVRLVIQDAMEIVRADLMFRCAYPDATYTIATIRASLIEAASRYPNTATVRRRLMFEEDYLTRMVPLVSYLIIKAMLLTVTPHY
jgi:hypothetical protein